MPIGFKERWRRAGSAVRTESDRGRKLQVAVLVGALCTFALMWGSIAYHLHIKTEVARQQAHRDVMNLATAVGAQMERLFVGVDQVMSIMQDDFVRSPDTFDFALWMRRATSLKQVANQVSMWDADGDLVASLIPLKEGKPSINVSDREYFRRLASDRTNEIHIGRTMMGRMSDQLVIQVAKRLERPDGQFAGVLLVSLRPENVADRFKEYDVGPHGTVAVTGRDGRVRARHPANDAIYDFDFRHYGPNRTSEALTEGSTFGSNESFGPIDGQLRFLGYRAVRGYPLVATVGRRYDDVMAPYRNERILVLLVGFVATTAGLIFLVALLRELELRRKRNDLLSGANAELEAKEADLRESHGLQATAEHLAKVGHWHVDLATGKLRVSEETLRIWGVAPGGFPFTLAAIAARVHPEDREGFLAWWRRAKAEARDADHEYRICLDDGSTKQIHVRNVFERNERGSPVAVLGAVMDVTERRAIESDLRTSREQTETALRQAEDASRAKSDFLASMSHELRTPLNAVIGFTGLMIDSGNLKKPEMLRYARTVQDAGRTLLSVVNDVLDVSKLEAGGVDLDPRPFDLRQMIERTSDFLRQEATAKGLSFRVELDPDLPEAVSGDDVRLRQILLNLLSNAVKFTEVGGVTISASRVDPIGERIRFAVEDTGIGIPDDKLHRLFVRFSQVDGSTARRFGGTGLGLSICKDLVGLMGGEIAVATRGGGGSVFSFEIDLPIVAAAAAAPRTMPTARPHAEGLSILLAEDVPTNRDLAVALLRSWGHAVDVVSDGEAVVSAVQARDYDLVLMDVQMPVLDGIQAARRIRDLDPPRSRVPIVAMTANVMRADVAAAAAAGMDGHVGKPFSPDELRAAVDRCAVRRGSPSTARRSWSTRRADAQDATTFESLRRTIGPAAARSLLVAFEEQLRETWPKAPVDEEDWRRVLRHAHDLVSAAGLLGFASLSVASRELTNIIQDGGAASRRAYEALDIARMEQAAAAEDLRAKLVAETLPDNAA